MPPMCGEGTDSLILLRSGAWQVHGYVLLSHCSLHHYCPLSVMNLLQLSRVGNWKGECGGRHEREWCDSEKERREKFPSTSPARRSAHLWICRDATVVVGTLRALLCLTLKKTGLK
eukprot:5834267-Amphidinium_carterae.4